VGGDLILLQGRMRDTTSLTRGEALEAVESYMQANETLIRSYRRLLAASITPSKAWRQMRRQIATALVVAGLAGIVVGMLAQQLLRWIVQ
jgi:hypothetical protein